MTQSGPFAQWRFRHRLKRDTAFREAETEVSVGAVSEEYVGDGA
jgi:hypothetical protein